VENRAKLSPISFQSNLLNIPKEISGRRHRCQPPPETISGLFSSAIMMVAKLANTMKTKNRTSQIHGLSRNHRFISRPPEADLHPALLSGEGIGHSEMEIERTGVLRSR